MNARFSALHGASGVRDLDLYGRAPSSAAATQHQQQQGKPDGAAADQQPSGSGLPLQVQSWQQVSP